MEDVPTLSSESAMPLDGLAVGVDFLESIVVFLLSAAHPYAEWVTAGSDLKPAMIAERMRKAYLAAEESTRAINGDSAARPDGLSVTIESAAHLIMVHRVRTFGVATLFSREAPLGFARMSARQIVATLDQELPYPQEQAVVAVPPPRATMPGSAPGGPLGGSLGGPPGGPLGGPLGGPGAADPEASVDFDEPAPDTTPPRSSIGDRVRSVVSHLEAIAPDPHIVRMRVALRTGLGLEALVHPDQLNNEALLLIETAAEDILGLERGKLTEVARA